jgi:hypothetical protein
MENIGGIWIEGYAFGSLMQQGWDAELDFLSIV